MANAAAEPGFWDEFWAEFASGFAWIWPDWLSPGEKLATALAILALLIGTALGLAQVLGGTGDADYRYLLRLPFRHRSWRIRYLYLLHRLQAKLHAFYGAPFGGTAYRVCLKLALLYPFLAALLAWVSGFEGSINRLHLFPEIRSELLRFAAAAGIMSWMLVCMGSGYMARDCKSQERSFNWMCQCRFFSWVAVPVWNRVVESRRARIQLLRYNRLILCAILAVSLFAGFGGYAGLAAGLGWGVGLGATFLIFIGINMAIGDGALWFFFFILPILNGFFDWVSLGATRYLLGDVEAVEGSAIVGGIFSIWSMRMAIHVVVDLILALILLWGLAIVLPVAAIGVNRFVYELSVERVEVIGRGFGNIAWWEIGINWRDYLDVAVALPGGEGLFVTIMLATTLVPTAVHAVAALILLAFGGPLAMPAYRAAVANDAPDGGLVRVGVILGFLAAILVGLVLSYAVACTVYAALVAGGEQLAFSLEATARASGEIAERLLGVPPP